MSVYVCEGWELDDELVDAGRHNTQTASRRQPGIQRVRPQLLTHALHVIAQLHQAGTLTPV